MVAIDIQTKTFAQFVFHRSPPLFDELPFKILNIQLLQNQESLLQIASIWRDLAVGMPFRQPEWLLSWWETYQNDSMELFVVVVRDDEDLIQAIAPWYLDLPTRTIRFLGDGKVCTDHASIIVDTRFHFESPIERLVEYLIQGNRTKVAWASIHLEAVNASDTVLQSFQSEMLRQGCKCYRSKLANTWQVDQPAGWDAFLEGLSKNARKMFRKRAADLDQVRINWVQDKADLADFLPVLTDLHQRRRNSLGDEGCFADPKFSAFLALASERLLERNQLQAFSLWLDGQPIAADIGFRSPDRWLCYQAGIDPGKMDREPGKLANVYILKNAERFGIRTVDFLRGDEPYKQQLKADPHPVQDLRFSRPGIRGKTKYLGWQTREWMKSIAKRMRRK